MQQKQTKPPHKKNTAGRRASFSRLGIFVFIFLGVLMMGLQLQDIVGAIAAGKAPAAVPPVQAETKAAEKMEEKKPEEKSANAKTEDSAEGDLSAEQNPETEENYSEAEVNILKRLSERRQELEKRTRELDQREALMRLTEQRVDKKMNDLKVAQEQLAAAIGAAEGEQKKRAESLVKIYESMKPKEAARIFETLDTGTLLAVVSNMKEARVAPILAAMEPTKARAVTTALMEKKPLPAVPQ